MKKNWIELRCKHQNKHDPKLLEINSKINFTTLTFTAKTDICGEHLNKQ